VNKFDGFELKLARIRARIKQKEFAVEVGLAASTLSLIENNLREAHPDEIQRIKKALKKRGIDCHVEVVIEGRA